MKIPTPNQILLEPYKYLYLKKKRKFKMDDTDVVYGQDEQNDCTVVFSLDLLENQYPVYDIHLRTTKTMVQSVSDYKNLYYPLSIEDNRKHIPEESVEKILESLETFVSLQKEEWDGREVIWKNSSEKWLEL